MHVTKRNRFYWIMMDAPTKRQSTVHIELKYDVLDRQFNASFRRRQTPRQNWPKWRAAKPDELAIAKAQLSPEELAACLAESINPSIWTRLARLEAAADRMRRSYAADAAGMILKTKGVLKIGGGGA